MEDSNQQTRREISISITNLEDIIIPRLNTLSPAQWALLSQGVRDAHITHVMADILTVIFQRCVESSLTILTPLMAESMENNAYSRNNQEPIEEVSVRLTSLIATEMANALEVSPEIGEIGEKLNSLMEEEVSQKVTSIAKTIRETKLFPAEPVIYASNSVSTLKNFKKMISNTAQCLRAHINKVRFKCVERYWSAFTKKRASGKKAASLPEPETSEESVSPNAKAGLDEESLCKFITEVIEKYSDDFKSSDDDSKSVQGLDISQTIKQISQTIIQDLHCCQSQGSVGQKDKICSCLPHFNLKKIISNVQDIFKSKLQMGQAGKQDITNRPEFSTFVEQQFTSMFHSLQKSISASVSNVVKLSNLQENSSKLVCLSFPGLVREDSSEHDTPKIQELTELDQFCKLDFECIKPQITLLCAQGEENPHLNNMIRQFAKELTNQLYVDIMGSHYFKIPVPPKGKFLSDSVLSGKKIRDISGQLEICPELFYARTEDEVRAFLQRIFLWIQDEEWTKDKVSGVLTEINDLVGHIYQSPRVSPSECCQEFETDETIQLSTGISVCSEDMDDNGYIKIRSHTDSLILTSQNMMRKPSTSDQLVVEFQTRKKNQEPNEFQEPRGKFLDEGTMCILLQAVLDCSKENGGPLKSRDMKRILFHLNGEEVDEIADIAVSLDNVNVRHFVGQLYNSLKHHFGSTEGMWRPATSEGGHSFQSAVLDYLYTYIPSPSPKCAFHRFLSAIMRPWKKLFGKHR